MSKINRKPHPFNFLCVVEKDNHIIELLEAHSEKQINIYSSLYKEKGCEISWHDLAPYKEENVFPEKKEDCKRFRGSALKDSPSLKRNKSWNSPVRCIETGKEYKSILECSNKTGISHYYIRTAALKGQPIKGLHFEYVKK